MKVAVILPAAGLGTRMGKSAAEKAGTSRKQFMLLDGSPILMHTVRKFAASDRVGRRSWWPCAAKIPNGSARCWRRNSESGRVRVVEGGNSRQESVENALTLARAGIRPGGGARRGSALHRPGDDPQGLRRGRRNRRRHRRRAGRGHGEAGDARHQPRAHSRHAAARKAGDGADSAGIPLRSAGARFRGRAPGRLHRHRRSSLVERLDVEVSVVPGSDRNIKITKPSDMELAHLFLREETRGARP